MGSWVEHGCTLYAIDSCCLCVYVCICVCLHPCMLRMHAFPRMSRYLSKSFVTHDNSLPPGQPSLVLCTYVHMKTWLTDWWLTEVINPSMLGSWGLDCTTYATSCNMQKCIYYICVCKLPKDLCGQHWWLKEISAMQSPTEQWLYMFVMNSLWGF